ncbi:MAG: response regulator [Candidatus Brocadiales bacterium]|nr:response regulator [Candidatus Brocadiales bacterium]
MKTNRRILVVDDNIDYCEGIIDFLEMEGFDAIGVHDGFKALEAVKKEVFDLVLMDVRMPGMDGVETFQKLKSVSPETPTILMTAFAVESRIREALRNGVFGAFQKPVDNERLICSIKKSFPGGAVVMIADDDRELCSNLLSKFAEKGYRGVVVGKREMAIRMASEKKFDIILIDTKQKDINGFETYQKIRDFRPDVNIIFVTDNIKETENLIDQVPKNDVCAFLEKPLDIDNLLEVVQKALDDRR